jgi:drug/metabolite transporter (DMT)-like permease
MAAFISCSWSSARSRPAALGERVGWLAALGTLVAIGGVVLAALRGETEPARVLPQSPLPEQETIR